VVVISRGFKSLSSNPELEELVAVGQTAIGLMLSPKESMSCTPCITTFLPIDPTSAMYYNVLFIGGVFLHTMKVTM
jgi:hypothetical protein